MIEVVLGRQAYNTSSTGRIRKLAVEIGLPPFCARLVVRCMQHRAGAATEQGDTWARGGSDTGGASQMRHAASGLQRALLDAHRCGPRLCGGRPAVLAGAGEMDLRVRDKPTPRMIPGCKDSCLGKRPASQSEVSGGL